MIREFHVTYRTVELPMSEDEAAQESKALIDGRATSQEFTEYVDRVIALDQRVAALVREVCGDAINVERYDAATSLTAGRRTLMFTITGDDPKPKQGRTLLVKLQAAGYEGVGCAPCWIAEDEADEAVIERFKAKVALN